MIQIFQTNEENKLINIEMENFIGNNHDLVNKWINLVNPTDKEVEQLIELTNIPEEIFKAPLDEEERARIEKEDDVLLMLVDIPTLEEEEGYYSYNTIPLGVIIKDEYLITVCLKETVVIRDFVMGRVKEFFTFKRTRFVFQILYITATRYLNYLKQIDKASQRIQNELQKSTKNKEVLQLLDLTSSLVYFSTSLTSNDLVISKLVNTSAYLKKYEEDQDLVEDVAIENKQAIAMCNIYRDILGGTMDAFASVISNNQNNVMKTLTVATIVLSVPTLVASFFGMNTAVPWGGSLIGFWLVCAFSLLLSLIVGLAFFWKRK